MTLKLLFAPADGKILGAQIIGGEGVDKRIDVLAKILHPTCRDSRLSAPLRACQQLDDRENAR